MTSRTANSIWLDTPTTEAIDDGSPLVGGVEQPANQLFNLTIPDVDGPWLDSTGAEFAKNKFQVAKVATAFTPPADLTTLTPAEFANFTISVGGSSSAAAGTPINAMSRSGNNNPGNGNPFQHSEEHLNEGDIAYSAGVYTIGTAGNYAIDYSISQVGSNNTGYVAAGLFVNGLQQGAPVGLVNDNAQNWPFGGSSEISLPLSSGNTVELRQVATPGFGGTNKVTSISITQIPSSPVLLPEDVVVTNPTEVDTNTVLKPNGDGTATFKSSGTIYDNIADQPVPDANKNTYAVDLPALEVGDKFTVVMARGVLIYNLIGRFIGFGFEHEFIFDGIVWRVEIVGTQLRIEAFSGGGSQAVKAIFIER